MRKYIFLVLIFSSLMSFAQQNEISDLENKKKEILSQIKILNDSIKKIELQINAIKLKEIQKMISNSTLKAIVLKGAKLKKTASPWGELITSLSEDKEVIILDYNDSYFRVCVGSICGFMSDVWIKKDDKIYKFIRLKEAEDAVERELKRELKRLEREQRDSIVKAIEYERKRKDSLKEIERINKNKKIRLENIKLEEERRKEYINDCNYIVNEKDEFTKLIRKNTLKYKVDKYENNKSDLRIQLIRYGNSKYVRIRSNRDLGCTSPYSTDKSYVKFKLENGDIVTFFHRDDIDCGNFNLLGKLTQNDIVRLKKSPIKTVRLNGTDYYHDVENLFFKDFFIKKLDCLK
ncbi:MAG: hypothetical protein IIB06_03130 [Bacteroidetes bacterium]|nr:hypothetical protein [Bacteroidota bacterium]